MFKKVLKAEFPRPARYSQRSSAPGATHAVRMEAEYKAQSDPENEVPPEQRTRAFMARHPSPRPGLGPCRHAAPRTGPPDQRTRAFTARH